MSDLFKAMNTKYSELKQCITEIADVTDSNILTIKKRPTGLE
jgi:hypothetical protein